MREIKLQKAIQRLSCEGARYVSMINFLTKNRIEKIEEANGAIIARLWSEDGEKWGAVAADSLEQLRSLKDKLGEVTHFFGVESWMLPILLEERELVWQELCYTYYIPKDLGLPQIAPLPDMELRFADVIDQYWSYQGDWTLSYIESCLKQAPSSGKFVDGKPVAWSVIQDDGAMGCMFVLPEHRRKGYAKEVTYDLVRKLREQDLLPFMHIVQTNSPSIQLAETMGFERLKEIVWCEVK